MHRVFSKFWHTRSRTEHGHLKYLFYEIFTYFPTVTETYDLAKAAHVKGLGPIRKVHSPGSRQAGALLSFLNIKLALKHPKTPSISPLPHCMLWSQFLCSENTEANRRELHTNLHLGFFLLPTHRADSAPKATLHLPFWLHGLPPTQAQYIPGCPTPCSFFSLSTAWLSSAYKCPTIFPTGIKTPPHLYWLPSAYSTHFLSLLLFWETLERAVSALSLVLLKDIPARLSPSALQKTYTDGATCSVLQAPMVTCPVNSRPSTHLSIPLSWSLASLSFQGGSPSWFFFSPTSPPLQSLCRNLHSTNGTLALGFIILLKALFSKFF